MNRAPIPGPWIVVIEKISRSEDLWQCLSLHSKGFCMIPDHVLSKLDVNGDDTLLGHALGLVLGYLGVAGFVFLDHFMPRSAGSMNLFKLTFSNYIWLDFGSRRFLSGLGCCGISWTRNLAGVCSNWMMIGGIPFDNSLLDGARTSWKLAWSMLRTKVQSGLNWCSIEVDGADAEHWLCWQHQGGFCFLVDDVLLMLVFCWTLVGVTAVDDAWPSWSAGCMAWSMLRTKVQSGLNWCSIEARWKQCSQFGALLRLVGIDALFADVGLCLARNSTLKGEVITSQPPN